MRYCAGQRRAFDIGNRRRNVDHLVGRQLDGAIASIRALPGIAEAVGGRAPALVDGGFRRGADVTSARTQEDKNPASAAIILIGVLAAETVLAMDAVTVPDHDVMDPSQ